MKTRVQAQHLQPGDIVGSGEVIRGVILNSIKWSSKHCLVQTDKRNVLWRKATVIGVERQEDE